MWSLLKIELFKIFRRPRTYIAFGAVAIVVFLFQIALWFDGRTYVDLILGNIDASFDFSDQFKHRLLNGYFHLFCCFEYLLIQMPLLVALIAGDAIAGEANMGTLRLSLTRPVSRTQYMWVSFLHRSSIRFSCCVSGRICIIWQYLAFGTNDLVIFRSTSIHQMTEDDIFWRYLAAFAYATIALTTVAALAFLLSVFAENSVGPIIATMSIVIVFYDFFRNEHSVVRQNGSGLPLYHSHGGWKGSFMSNPTLRVQR